MQKASICILLYMVLATGLKNRQNLNMPILTKYIKKFDKI